jgi:outer membrane receptor protein involved in Fe transport
MPQSSPRIVAIVICFLAFSSALGMAQVVGAILTGSAVDPSGAAVPNAQINIRNLATGIVTEATSNSSGIYSVPNLLPGQYEVSARAPGLMPKQRARLTLTVGEKQVLNLELQIASASATLEVSAETNLVELGSAAMSQVVDGLTARELPLNGRDWTQLATLEPGISAIRTQPDANGLNNRGNRGFGGQLTISGARPQQNNYRLDGISVNDYANSSPGSTAGLSLGAESIAEFSVVSSNYSAAYGLTSGGVINAMTRAGTNALHGSAYEFLRNDAVDARGFFDASKLPFRRNQFGAAAGGPIAKSKTFFFVNFEGLRQSLTTTTIATVPTLTARSGQLVAGTVKVDPSAQRYLGLWAAPNGAISGDAAIYSFAGKAILPENFGTVRIDHSISASDTLHGSYLFDSGSTTQPDAVNSLFNQNRTRRQVGSIEETHIFGPSFVNTARIGANRVVAATLNTLPGANPLASDPSLGIQPGLYAPAIQVTGVSSLLGGLNGTSYGNYWFTTWQFYDDAFRTIGKHSLKFGFFTERIDSNFYLAANPDGVFKFNSLSDFLTNKPASLQFQYGTLTPRGARQSIYGAYAEDDYRLTPHLTLNLGLRYEPSSVPYEVNGKFANLRTLGSSQIYTGGPLFHDPALHNFEPRLGVAWDPFGSGKTSVRGGFGMFDALPLTYQFNLMEVSAAPFQSVASSSILPQGSFPSGALTLVQQGTGLRTSYIEFDPRRSYVMQWNGSIQRQFGNSFTVMLGYVGSRGVHNAMRTTDANGVIPSLTSNGLVWPCAVTVVNGVCSKPGGGARFNATYGQIDGQVWNGSSSYNALLFTGQRRLAKGLETRVSFTWSRSLDTGSSVGSGGPFSNSISGQFLFSPIRGLSDFNIGRTLVASGTWEIPFAKAKAWGGWQLGAIVNVSDGLPFSATISGDALGQANQSLYDVPDRLNLSGCKNPVNVGDPMHYIKLSCFAFPNPSTRFGDAGRNNLIGPGVITADLSLSKIFTLHESLRLQLRAEAFNAANRANFAAPLTNNKLFDTKGVPVNFAGQITTLQTNPRQLQLALKFLW